MAKTLPVKALDTVTTDAVYRQTMNKEAAWRARGCAGVDMEAAALLQEKIHDGQVPLAVVTGQPATALFLGFSETYRSHPSQFFERRHQILANGRIVFNDVGAHRSVARH